MKTSKSKAVWKGNLKEGNGVMHVGSLSDTFAYTFASRFADGKNTNPEEMIAAAHSGCFSMALANSVSEHGYQVDSIETEAEVKLDQVNGAFKITETTLNVLADIPGIDEGTFMKFAVDAREKCPVSEALSSVKVKMNAHLMEHHGA